MTNFKKAQEEWEDTHLSLYAKKSSMSRRWKSDPTDDYRTEYQRDIGRIIFSDAFRRLRMKAQVFIASGLDQHNRTRLTHSLEVAQIAKSIARPLRLNTDLTEAIALGHDLGHTPFGHAGERALQKCLKTTTFHHNVQSVWILRSTMCGRTDKFGEIYPGYNLTYDVLEGIWKHTEYNNTTDEIKGLNYLRPNQPPFLEGQVVQIADTIAYLKHDIEDGIRNNIITSEQFEDMWRKATDLPCNYSTWSHFLILDVINNSKDKPIIGFNLEIKNLFENIKTFTKENIIKSKLITQKDQEGEEIVTAIFDYCIKNPEFVLTKAPNLNRYKLDKHGVERMIIDYIQWLGDENARQTFNQIKG